MKIINYMNLLKHKKKKRNMQRKLKNQEMILGKKLKQLFTINMNQKLEMKKLILN